MARTPKQVELLLVEDDPGDVAMTREALSQPNLPVNMNVVSDGESAVSYLRREAPYTSATRPDLVLLDLNLPRLSGQEVLAQVKSDPSLADIPVVVLTTSRAHSDILRSYQLHANAYVVKPIGFKPFVSAVAEVGKFFLTTAELPHG